MLLLEGGRVVCPASGKDVVEDVLIDGGHIVAVGPGLRAAAGEGVRVIDCEGVVVAPGFVELGAELADPGHPERETLCSGSEAAAAGGYTTVLASPNTDPCVDGPSVARDILGRAAALTGARVLQAGALTMGLRGEEPAELGLLVLAGCVALSDGRALVADTEVLRRCLEYARPFDVPVMLRPGEAALERAGVMHEGSVSLRIGLRGIPAESEEIGLHRLIALARRTGARVHISHLSTGRSLAAFRAAVADGLSITATVPARSLVLTDVAVERSGYDPLLRLVPPLRPEADRVALVGAVRAGEVGVCADHVPCSIVDKEVELVRARPGAVGLETALGATLAALGGDVVAAVRALSILPGRVIGLHPRVVVGSPADLVLFDPVRHRDLSRSPRSRGRNEPLHGHVLPGRVRATVVAGHVVFGPIPD